MKGSTVKSESFYLDLGVDNRGEEWAVSGEEWCLRDGHLLKFTEYRFVTYCLHQSLLTNHSWLDGGNLFILDKYIYRPHKLPLDEKLPKNLGL